MTSWTLTSPRSSEFYEPNALMMEEEGAVIAGLLVGLNVIDANLCMKGEDLDSQVMDNGSSSEILWKVGIGQIKIAVLA